MLNNCVLVGRVVERPQMKETSSGVKVGTLVLEVDRSFKSSEGMIEQDLFSVQLWRGIAETCCDVCTPGSLVGVKGRLQAFNHKKEDGQLFFNCEVIAEKVSFISINSVS